MRSRWWVRGGVAALVVLCLLALGFVGRQSLARFAIVSAASAFGHVNVSFDGVTIGLDRAVLTNVRITSLHDEPIATIERLSVRYRLRDLFPGSTRLFGLEALDLERPHVTVIRHADGSYNVPVPKLPQQRGGKQTPLAFAGRIHDGSIEIVDRSRTGAPSHHLYVERLEADAEISTAARSHYTIALTYGERDDRLYPIQGSGDIDLQSGRNEQHWSAPKVPIAGIVDFVLNSPSLRLESGELARVDARIFSIPGENGTLQAHLASSAYLSNCRIAVAGLAKPIRDIHGRVDVSEHGLLTERLDATVAGVPAQISGGVTDPAKPHVRLAVRGRGDLAVLRSAFVQAARLPVRGPIDFSLLAEGSATQPLTWISLRSPHIVYNASSVSTTTGLVAFDGREADIVDFATHYGSISADARGRAGLKPAPNAIQMVLGIHAPPDVLPHANALLPSMPLHAIALASASDPKAIEMRGLISGASPTQSLGATFNVASNGTGSIGPLFLTGARGSIYARVALDHPHATSLALVDVRGFAIPAAHAALSATLFGSETKTSDNLVGNAQMQGGWGQSSAVGRLSWARGALAGALAGTLRFASMPGAASFGASITGTPASPRLASAFVLTNGRYRDFALNGNAGGILSNGTLAVREAALQLGPAFLATNGTVGGLRIGHAPQPRYNLDAELHTSDVRALVAAVARRMAAYVQGSIDANVHVNGLGSAPAVRGSIAVAEGSVNGLAFRDMHATLHGDRNAASLTNGRVAVGSTAIAFGGDRIANATHVSVRTPYADLADFNDFFDTGDMFAGTGRLAFDASLVGTQVSASSGDANFSGARFRRIEFGNLAAHWRGTRETIAGTVAFGGESGTVHVAGRVTPSLADPVRSDVDVNATVGQLDLGTWMPMLGVTLPVTGRLDASASASGRYPNIAMSLHAALSGATAGRLAIQRFELTAAASHGRGVVRSATIELPSLTTTLSGSFGLRPSDPFDLVAHSTSSDIGALIGEVTGNRIDLAGALDSSLHVQGTASRPSISDTLLVQSLRYGKLVVPRIAGTIAAQNDAVTLAGGEIDLAQGRLLLSGRVPVRLDRKVAPADAPVSASAIAEGVDLSNILPLLPSGTKASGKIDGRVGIGGRLNAPQLSGSLALRGGTFSGPTERAPITGLNAVLAFAGTTATLHDAHADVGGGSIAASGTASLPSLSVGNLAFSLQMRTDKAHFEMPAYFTGNINAAISVDRRAGGPISVGGAFDIASARIPLNAFLNPGAPKQPHAELPPVAFDDLRITAGPDVRVQSANVDIGAKGSATLGGTLAAPRLVGRFDSTGGTLNFYRTFRLESGRVTFDSSTGVIPDVDAVATTYISDPQTSVRLQVTGPATNMNLALASDPVYNREQILGLLIGAQQFGAVRGVQSTQNGGFSLPNAAQNIALGQMNQLFTRNLLQPLSTSIGSAVGLTDFQITSDIQTGLGLNAVKAFGKNVTASASQSFGYPSVQSVTIEARPTTATSLRLRIYTAQAPALFGFQPTQTVAMGALNLNPMTAIANVYGTNGIDFSFVRRFP